ncbi:phosphotransferase enzyme family protein [Wenjunlia tyrosinilytica]|uniref:Aminoglycoside phosphotransferase n=1 Tax=Wenjunlia tyrosinilytica TaxID=1544741 RepID=A0A918DYI8_9ACTN|nr:aminoglycoside phosphotransferase family protein [Wenjunlia tyrosinilytica]GGO92251.1 aminoglycoside phosphotransferase [Wenjunlia tyrosinilytica]
MEAIPLSQDSARRLLSAAGFDGPRARLLALGENAVFALAEGPVAKVGRTVELLERARHEMRVARWLAEQGVPAVRAARAEPLLVEGSPMTLWEPLPAPVRQTRPADLAQLLRLVHALPEPPFPLPERDLLGGVERWLGLAQGHVDPADMAFLRARRDEYALAGREVKPVLDPGPIHGDALPRNVLVGPDGPVLMDLETFSTDLREHDLVVMALTRDRYGMPDSQYRSFTSGYGWDVTEWDGCLVLRGARETASAAWVAQQIPGNPAALAEFRRRVASLREGDPAVRWHSF